jgi:chorismate mutase
MFFEDHIYLAKLFTLHKIIQMKIKPAKKVKLNNKERVDEIGSEYMRLSEQRDSVGSQIGELKESARELAKSYVTRQTESSVFAEGDTFECVVQTRKPTPKVVEDLAEKHLSPKLFNRIFPEIVVRQLDEVAFAAAVESGKISRDLVGKITRVERSESEVVIIRRKTGSN